MFPVGKGAETIINITFKCIYHPVHSKFSKSLDFSQLRIHKIIGRILFQSSVVRIVITFYSGDNKLCIGVIHIFFHAPAFAVGGI